VKNKIFVWGGSTGDENLCHSRLDLFSLNILTGDWNRCALSPQDHPPLCSGASSTSIGNTIYSHGGVISKSPFTICDKFYKLNLEEKRWRKVESTGIQPEGRCGAKMCRVYDKLLLMGGYGSLPLKRYHPQAQYMEGGIGGVGYGWNNELLEFDPETACWSPVSVSSSKPSPRHGHTLTNIDENRAIMFGGQNLEESFSDLWLFDHKRRCGL
jgi:N-acetylneuraminic acid mutarotase